MKLLISAYACRPDMGSEPAVGWNWVLEYSKLCELVVLTNFTNKPYIEEYLASHKIEFEKVRFVYVKPKLKVELWGYGKYKTQYATLPSHYKYAWTMAHNQILDLMLRGGIIILALWLGVLFIIIRKNQKNKSIYSKLSTYTLFCLLFFFHTEASMDVITYLIFLCLYLIGQKENNKGELKRKRYEVTKE